MVTGFPQTQRLVLLVLLFFLRGGERLFDGGTGIAQGLQRGLGGGDFL